MRISSETRFWKKVDKSPNEKGCWNWTGKPHRKADGKDWYGRFTVNRKCENAHRWSYRFTHGEIPDGLFVLHTCDNPLCVNPSHLYLGTDADNTRDKIERDRFRDKFDRPQLSPEQIELIRNEYALGELTLEQVGERHERTLTTIWRATRGVDRKIESTEEKFWKRVDKSPNEKNCWIWIDSRKRRYGRIHFNGIEELVHRYSYTIYKGLIPEGAKVCQSCSNNFCVNPDHLFLKYT